MATDTNSIIAFDRTAQSPCETEEGNSSDTPHKICFRALDKVDIALIEFQETMAAAVRLEEAERDDDPERQSFFTVMERHLTRDLQALGNALDETRKVILEHAHCWRRDPSKKVSQ